MRTATISRRACWAGGFAAAALLGGAAVALGEPVRLLRTLAGAAAVALLLEIAYHCWPEKLGYGDVRLIVANSLLTAWWGPAFPWWALLAGAVAAWPAAMRSALRDRRDGRVRWAPGLSIGTALVAGWRMLSVGALG